MATSRKSSSRKSSSRKSSSIKSSNKTNTTYNYISSIISLIINIFIIYYLLNLEHKSCNCIRDWRHNYIKTLTIFNIILSSLNLFGLINSQTMIGSSGGIVSIILILSIINIYAFYTYIGDLHDTQCECAISKQKNLHKFLYVWRYVMVFLPIFAIIFFLVIYFIFMILMNQKAL